jgi:acyl-CoA dehydrogenase
VHPQETELCELREELAREDPLVEPVPDVVEDVVADELPHRVADRLLLVLEEGVERKEVKWVERLRLGAGGRRHERDTSYGRRRRSRLDPRSSTSLHLLTDESIEGAETVTTTVETGIGTGVSFALTTEQRELRALAREFAEKEIRPRAAEYDEHSTHPADVIAKAHELGLMNLHIPESMGGPGLSAFDGVLVGEELSWGCSGIGTALCANSLGAAPVLIAGTDAQKDAWLPPLLERPLLCSFGLSEPDAGSDVARMKTRAELRGDEYVINGSKTFITNAGRAAWTVVFAKTDPSKGHRGISAFVVPMDAPGVQIEKHLDKMGQRSTDTSAFALTDVVVPVENRLGEEGEGFKIAMKTLDFTRPGTAAGAVGVAQAAFELAVEYAKERVTFDVPIAMHQGVNFLIADMATEIEAARLLVWQSAWLHDQGERATLQSSFAKRFAADTAMKVTTDAVQIFGGYGYIKEYPVEKLMRDAKLFQIYEGTSQIQRLVIAKEIFLPRDD